MCVPTVYRCVKLLCDSVATLPLQFMRRKGGLFVFDEGDRINYLLGVQPDQHVSSYDFMSRLVKDVLLEGNAYVVPVYSMVDMSLERLALVRPACVQHDTLNDLYHVSDDINGVYGTYTEDSIIHVKGMTGRDPKKGLSVLAYARLTTGTAISGDKETKQRFENGGTVRGLVHNDASGVRGFGEYEDSELESLANTLDRKLNVETEHIVSVPSLAKFTPTSSSSVDMQFLETRKFTVREICRFFGVHPSLVFDDTSNNYKSAEMANVAFLSNTLNPLLRNIETEFQRKLVAPSLAFKRKIQFDRRGLYACDLDSRVKYQTQTIAAGLYTVNDWRAEENRPAVEGGDKVFISANLKDINDTTAAPVAAPQKTIESNGEEGQE